MIGDRNKPRLVPNYLAQATSAEEAMRRYFEQLEQDGWVYNERQRYWYHPKLPGITVSS